MNSIAATRVAPRPRRHSTWLGALLAVLLVGITAACVPDGPPPDPYKVLLTLGDDTIDVEWSAPSGTNPAGYQLQVGTDSGWIDLVDTTERSYTLTEVENHVQYHFRVRTAASGSVAAGAWSPTAKIHYIDLVLPIVRIDTTGRAPILDKENYVPGTVTIDPNGSGYEAYTGTMGIRGRGNSTWMANKKPYRVKLDKKSPIMGIASERDWVLLANSVDRSHLRSFAAGLASEATDLAYTPTFRAVEVVLNGQYNGVYLLTQHNEVGPDRVDITEMEPEDNSGVELTGGYRLEVDARLEENNEPGFRTTKNIPVVVKDPDPMTTQQRNYIRNYVQAFEDSLFASNFADPVNGYRKYLDTPSFVDHYLVQELTRNQDVFFSSTFFTKERGEDRFKFGPIWDFDNSMGSIRGVDSPPEGWWARERGPWPRRIFHDPAFVQEVNDRWDELKPAFEQIGPELEAIGATLVDAKVSDSVRWGFVPHETDTPEFLSDWLATRIAWIDSQVHPTPAE